MTRGAVCYGPNVVAAAPLLASTDVIGVERAAGLMAALLRAPVSTGFVSRCLARLDTALTAAGFEDALKDDLASGVLGTDETLAPLATAAASGEGYGNPHVFTVRTLRAWTSGGPDLIWSSAAGNQVGQALLHSRERWPRLTCGRHRTGPHPRTSKPNVKTSPVPDGHEKAVSGPGSRRWLRSLTRRMVVGRVSRSPAVAFRTRVPRHPPNADLMAGAPGTHYAGTDRAG